jgi:hypothetical protein
MNPRLAAFFLALFTASAAFAQTPLEIAQKVTVSMKLNDVPPGAAVHFVELLAGIKIHYQGHPGDQTVLTLDFENTTADAALKYIADLAKLELSYKADGAHLAPKK